MRVFLVAAVLVLAVVPSHAHAQEATASRAVEALQLIREWRVEDARPKVEALLLAHPTNPMVQAVAGQLKFHLGDYEGAMALFKAARDGGVPPAFLLDAGAAEKARVATEGYEETVTEHFVIRYPPGKDALLVPFAEEALEAARERIGDLLGWKPKERVVVEIYPTAKTLAAVSALTPKDIETSGTIALCRWNRLMITSPRAVVFGYAWRDTLAHELTHLIIGGASRDTVPIWLHEGLAKYSETAWRGEPGLGISGEQQLQLRQAAKQRKLITFEQMHPSMAKLPSQEAASLAFTEVFTFIEYLVARKGWAAVRETLREMSGGKSTADALGAVFGESLAVLEQKWKRSLATRKIKSPDPLQPVKGDRKLVIKERASTPDDELHGLNKKARRHARAADLLFARGRYVAAQSELERAFEESSSPLVSAKLATLALANDDLTKAEEAARSSIRSMPELAGPNVTLAEILLRRGKRAEMKEPLGRAIDINPFDPRIHKLTLAAEGEDGEPEVLARARRALALTGDPGGALRSKDTGRGARVRVEGLPFARVYLTRGGQRIATRMVTPTPPLDLRPGEWTVELQPPLGPAVKRDVRIKASDTVRTIQIDESEAGAKAP